MEVLCRSWKAASLGRSCPRVVAAAFALQPLQQRRSITRSHQLKECESIDADYEQVMAYAPYAAFFKDEVFRNETPLLMKAPSTLLRPSSLKAITKWFQSRPSPTRIEARKVMSDYLRKYAEVPFPYELTYPQHHRMHGEVVTRFLAYLEEWETIAGMGPVLAQIVRNHLPELGEGSRVRQSPRFVRFDAPLALFDAALQYNARTQYHEAGRLHPGAQPPLRTLYIAQASLSMLPPELQQDLPVPRLVKETGRGDIYGSSLWLGLAHTYTSLHRDPNPNVLIQMYGSKVVRLLPPDEGQKLFVLAQTMLNRAHGNSAIRGAEMMEGEEMAFFHKAIWSDGSREKVSYDTKPSMIQATLAPGDALFIPKGWWHTVKSTTEAGELNGSVNWWFR